ncbi:O-methyltransferase [Nonomuraea sp. AD125B]|uniref:O-methyltransferase n=1 Tax=Nonomuraea sp. AD125B TaxID=3242897 RepID=UPI003528745B
MAADLPPLVVVASERAERYSYEHSPIPEVGRLLSVLTAHLPAPARVLEIGTGTGVGTAWIASGALPRADISVITLERNQSLAAIASYGASEGLWPEFVKFGVGDVLEILSDSEPFDLIFANAPAGKYRGLDLTIAALKPGGLLIVDDMTVAPESTWGHDRKESVRQALLFHPQLTAVELQHGSGVILATRRPAS